MQQRQGEPSTTIGNTRKHSNVIFRTPLKVQMGKYLKKIFFYTKKIIHGQTPTQNWDVILYLSKWNWYTRILLQSESQVVVVWEKMWKMWLVRMFIQGYITYAAFIAPGPAPSHSTFTVKTNVIHPKTHFAHTRQKKNFIGGGVGGSSGHGVV